MTVGRLLHLPVLFCLKWAKYFGFRHLLLLSFLKVKRDKISTLIVKLEFCLIWSGQILDTITKLVHSVSLLFLSGTTAIEFLSNGTWRESEKHWISRACRWLLIYNTLLPLIQRLIASVCIIYSYQWVALITIGSDIWMWLHSVQLFSIHVSISFWTNIHKQIHNMIYHLQAPLL